MKAKEVSVSVSIQHTIQRQQYCPTQLRGFASVSFDVEESDGNLSDSEIKDFIQKRFAGLWDEVGGQVTTQIKELQDD